MKKIYYIYVCLGVLLLTALPAKAASEAEFGKLAKTYTLHKDGSQEMRVYKELTLFTHAAMNGLYGESFIVYNPAYQELKIHESYTRQKDGKIVKTPENAFVEVLPAAAAGSGVSGTAGLVGTAPRRCRVARSLPDPPRQIPPGGAGAGLHALPAGRSGPLCRCPQLRRGDLVLQCRKLGRRKPHHLHPAYQRLAE